MSSFPISYGENAMAYIAQDKAGITYTFFYFHAKTSVIITITCLYNFDPLKPHFYIVLLGFTGVNIVFLVSAQKHRLWVLIRTATLRQF